MKKHNIVTKSGNPDLHLYKIKGTQGYFGEKASEIYKNIIEYFESCPFTQKLCVNENNNWYLLTEFEFNSKEEFYSHLEHHGVEYKIPEDEQFGSGHPKVVCTIETIF